MGWNFCFHSTEEEIGIHREETSCGRSHSLPESEVEWEPSWDGATASAEDCMGIAQNGKPSSLSRQREVSHLFRAQQADEEFASWEKLTISQHQTDCLRWLDAVILSDYSVRCGTVKRGPKIHSRWYFVPKMKKEVWNQNVG